jgi:integrase
MLEHGSRLPAGNWGCGRVTERSSLTRPRYQKGSLKAVGKNRWEIRWREDVVNADGSVRRVRHKETLQQKTKAEALEILDAYLAAVRQQQRQPGVAIPFRKFVETEWKPNAALRLRKSSMHIYTFNLEQHILPAYGAIPVRDLGRAHIEACLSGLQQKGYAVSTLRSVRATFSTVLEAAANRRFISENPAHRIRIREADSKRETRFYCPATVRELLAELTDPCRAIVATAVLAGLRIGEILALRWKRVDLLAETLEVAETYSSGMFGPPKTRSSRRVIPMSATLVGIFKQLRPSDCQPDDLVFRTAKGTPLSDKNLYNRELAPACDAIKQPRVSWHSFRHTHATLLHETGESLKTAQALLGHSDLETTLAVYTHAIPDSQKRAVERVAVVLDLDGPSRLRGQNSGERIN